MRRTGFLIFAGAVIGGMIGSYLAMPVLRSSKPEIRSEPVTLTRNASVPDGDIRPAGQRHFEHNVPIVPRGARFRCTPVRVWDGDGPLWCAEGPRIRLAGIAAREMDGTCRYRQPCPDASAKAARDHLVRLVGRAVGTSPEGHVLVTGEPLDCYSMGRGKGTRTAAWCETAAGLDLSCAMVDSGLTLRWPYYWGHHRCG